MGQQYKIGDRIKVIEHEFSVEETFQVGREGVVVQDDSDGSLLVNIKFLGDSDEWCYKLSQVELVSRPQTNLSDTVRDFILTEPDKVNPPHYKKGSVECIDAIKAATVGKSGFEGYLVGNVIKYVFRYEDKGGVEDLRKASWYLNKLIDEKAT